MGTEDKLYKKIQQATENASPDTFPSMEKVWSRVEEKLETNSITKEKNNWKKISVAATIIIVFSILFNFYKKEPEIIIEKNVIVINDSITKEEVLKEEQISTLLLDTTANKSVESSTRKDENQITYGLAPITINKKDSLKLLKKDILIIPNNSTSGYFSVADSTTKVVKKEKISFPSLQKGNKRTEYTNFQSISNKAIQNPKTTSKKTNPLVVINGNVEKISSISEIPSEEIDSIYILRNPLYIINDVEYSEESLFGKKPTSPYFPLDKQKIISTTILYKEEGEKLYGTKGKEGVVIIKTKNGKPNK